MIGLAKGALSTPSRYTKERKQFGKAIADFQAVQHQLARAAVDVEAATLTVYNAARLRDAGRPFLTEAAICKIFSSEVAERVASLAVNLFGGNGFVKDTRSKSSIATPRSARSTKARPTCSCRRSRSRSSDSAPAGFRTCAQLGLALLLLLTASIATLAVHRQTLRYGFDYDDYHFVHPYSRADVLRAFHGPWDAARIERPSYRR